MCPSYDGIDHYYLFLLRSENFLCRTARYVLDLGSKPIGPNSFLTILTLYHRDSGNKKEILYLAAANPAAANINADQAEFNHHGIIYNHSTHPHRRGLRKGVVEECHKHFSACFGKTKVLAESTAGLD